MAKSKNGALLLNNFLRLLQEERTALIQNRGEKIEKIVAEKERFLEELETADFSRLKKEQLVQAVKAIRQLQQTNLLLTEQTIQYQQTILEAIAQTAKKTVQTYSHKGQYQSGQQGNLLNQSL